LIAALSEMSFFDRRIRRQHVFLDKCSHLLSDFGHPDTLADFVVKLDPNHTSIQQLPR